MKKKSLLIIALILVMTFASLMVACGSGEEPAADADQQTAATVQEESAVSDSSEVASEETETAAATEAIKSAATEKTAEKAKATEATKSKATADKKADSKTSTKESVKQPTKQNTSATKATEAKKVCYITVDGYCSSKQIQLKGGESVYDILKATGADVSARNTGYGLYVEGINGRFEFDEGPTSGWVYTVNGTRPSTSCSNYEVKSGDKIVWTYVTEV